MALVVPSKRGGSIILGISEGLQIHVRVSLNERGPTKEISKDKEAKSGYSPKIFWVISLRDPVDVILAAVFKEFFYQDAVSGVHSAKTDVVHRLQKWGCLSLELFHLLSCFPRNKRLAKGKEAGHVLVMVFYLNELNNSKNVKEKSHSQHNLCLSSGNPPSIREQLAPFLLHVEAGLMERGMGLIISTLGLQHALFLKKFKHWCGFESGFLSLKKLLKLFNLCPKISKKKPWRMKNKYLHLRKRNTHSKR